MRENSAESEGRDRAAASPFRFPRVVDQFVDGIAHESKVGYKTLDDEIKEQIAKDAELITSKSVDGVTWHFFTSPVTGLGGASQPLLAALDKANIKVVNH